MRKQVLLIASVCLLIAVSGCYKKEKIPVADFSFTSSNDSIVPDTVHFQNQSTDAFSYSWDFGDSHTSTETNPVHIYTAAGAYSIILKSYSESQKEWNQKIRSIKIE